MCITCKENNLFEWWFNTIKLTNHIKLDMASLWKMWLDVWKSNLKWNVFWIRCPGMSGKTLKCKESRCKALVTLLHETTRYMSVFDVWKATQKKRVRISWVPSGLLLSTFLFLLHFSFCSLTPTNEPTSVQLQLKRRREARSKKRSAPKKQNAKSALIKARSWEHPTNY